MRVSVYNFILIDPENPRKKYSFKKQIGCKFEQLDAFVAPTIINIVSPTFWLTENFEEYKSEKGIKDDVEGSKMENLVRQIMKTTDFKINFDYYNKEFCDHTRPILNIEIKIGDAKAWFTSPNWWHLIFVLQCILFATGDKSVK
jgi:hypothetical protein